MQVDLCVRHSIGVLASIVSSYPIHLGSARITTGSRWSNGLPSQRRVEVSERSNFRNGNETVPWGLAACSSGESSTMIMCTYTFMGYVC